MNVKKIYTDYYHDSNLLRLQLKKGKNILKIKSDYSMKYDIQVYELKDENLDSLVKDLQSETLSIEKMQKGHLRGNINVQSNRKTLLITIPYQKGWNIYVDGKKTNYYEVYDTFIGLDLKKGKHQIVMRYENKPLKLGILMSILTLVITIFMLFMYNKRKVFKNIKKK